MLQGLYMFSKNRFIPGEVGESIINITITQKYRMILEDLQLAQSNFSGS
jgi:hypothetical protein